jgi:hypothetical protein
MTKPDKELEEAAEKHIDQVWGNEVGRSTDAYDRCVECYLSGANWQKNRNPWRVVSRDGLPTDKNKRYEATIFYKGKRGVVDCEHNSLGEFLAPGIIIAWREIETVKPFEGEV